MRGVYSEILMSDSGGRGFYAQMVCPDAQNKGPQRSAEGPLTDHLYRLISVKLLRKNGQYTLYRGSYIINILKV